MTVTEILDKTGKFLSRIRTAVTVIVVVLLAFYMFKNGYNKSEMNIIAEKVIGLDIQNDLLNGNIRDRDSIILAEAHSKKLLRDSITMSIAREKELENKNAILSRKFNDISGVLLKIPADSSYSFLDKTAYPYGGEKKYPFSDPQVKGIHRTYLEHQGLIALNENLQKQKGEMFKRIHLQEAEAAKNASTMSLMEDNRDDLEQKIENKDEVIELQDKALKKNKRKETWQKIGIGAGALLLGFLAGGA